MSTAKIVAATVANRLATVRRTTRLAAGPAAARAAAAPGGISVGGVIDAGTGSVAGTIGTAAA